MAHQIEEFDVTYSTRSPEWHGLAIVKTAKEMTVAIRDLFFPIVKADATMTIDGESIPLKDEITGKGWQIIAADCRSLPPSPGRIVQPPAFVPLHTPKVSYEPLENGAFFDAFYESFEKLGVAVELQTCGTLANLGIFYFSVSAEGFKIASPNGNDILSTISGITSHTGIYSPRLKDCHTWPVCANTVSALMGEIGGLDIQGKHTKNGIAEILNMGAVFESLLKGAEMTSANLASLESQDLTTSEMEEITAGYFVQPAMNERVNLDKLTLTKQAENAIAGIVNLAVNGRGNSGRTAFDLFNGATDYWSNGEGSGSDKVGMRKRAFRSQFGAGATHKTSFAAYLFDGPRVAQGRVVGSKVLANTMALAK